MPQIPESQSLPNSPFVRPNDSTSRFVRGSTLNPFTDTTPSRPSQNRTLIWTTPQTVGVAVHPTSAPNLAPTQNQRHGSDILSAGNSVPPIAMASPRTLTNMTVHQHDYYTITASVEDRPVCGYLVPADDPARLRQPIPRPVPQEEITWLHNNVLDMNTLSSQQSMAQQAQATTTTPMNGHDATNGQLSLLDFTLPPVDPTIQSGLEYPEYYEMGIQPTTMTQDQDSFLEYSKCQLSTANDSTTVPVQGQYGAGSSIVQQPNISSYRNTEAINNIEPSLLTLSHKIDNPRPSTPEGQSVFRAFPTPSTGKRKRQQKIEVCEPIETKRRTRRSGY